MTDKLIERLFVDNEENRIGIHVFCSLLHRWASGDETVSNIKTLLELTEDEAGELDDLLALAPSDISGLSGLLSPLALLAPVPRHGWVFGINYILHLMESRLDGYYSVSEVRTKVGL